MSSAPSVLMRTIQSTFLSLLTPEHMKTQRKREREEEPGGNRERMQKERDEDTSPHLKWPHIFDVFFNSS